MNEETAIIYDFCEALSDKLFYGQLTKPSYKVTDLTPQTLDVSE